MNAVRPVTTGLGALAPRYDALLCDIWGVVHNGIRPYPEAVDALVRYRELGGRVILVSNAARPHATIQAMLDGMGVDRAAYDAIVTSGDVTRDIVRQFAGSRIHHVGPQTDNPMLDGLGVSKGDVSEVADVVIPGLDDPAETPDDYDARIAAWLARDLPLVCANPDKFVEIGDRMVYCPGAIADIYAARGGKVLQAGKPHPEIYAAAVRLLGELASVPPRSRLLAIGDSVRTDATGAAAFGVDFLFITGSIHAGEIDAFGADAGAAIQRLVAPSGASLVAYMPRLSW